jgi:glutathione S-transferase
MSIEVTELGSSLVFRGDRPQVGIALEEMGYEYDAHTINIMKNEQFTPEFIAINPNSKIPALVDPNGPGQPRILDNFSFTGN